MSRRGMGSRGFLAKRPGLRVWLGIIKQDPCVWCGGHAGTVDHIVPESRWVDKTRDVWGHFDKPAWVYIGPHHWSNTAMACRSCNSRRMNQGVLWFLVKEHNKRCGGGLCKTLDAARAAASPLSC